MTTPRSEQDTVYENKISLIEESVNLIYDLHKIIQDHPPRLTRVILKSLGVSLLRVKQEWEQADVGKLEAKIKKLRERDLELSAIIGHMADQLIGRVPIKPVEGDRAREALIVDLQQRHNDLKEQLKEATNTIGELVAERDDLQKANAEQYMLVKELRAKNEHLVMANVDLRNKLVPNSDLIKANAKLVAENNDLRMQVKHLEGEVEPNEQIEKLTAELDDLRTKDDTEALAHAQEANTDLAKKVGKLERYIARQADRVNKLRRDKEILGEKLTRLKGDVGLSVDVPTMRKELDAKNRSIRHMHETIDELRQAKADLIKDRDSRYEEAQQERRQRDQLELAKRELADRRVMIGDLKGKLAVADKEIDLLKEQLSPDVYGKLAEKDKRIHELLLAGEEMEKELADRCAMIGDLKGKVKALESMIATRNSRVQSLLEENAELHKAVEVRGVRGDGIVYREASVPDLMKEIEKLRAENVELSGQVSNLQNLVARPDLGVPFIKSIDKIAKELDETQTSNKAMSGVIKAMSDENEALRKINKELEEERKERNAKIKELTEECEKVTLDRTDLVKQVRKAERHNKDLKGKLVEARTAIKELEDGHPPVDVQAEMIDQLQERNEKLQAENASLRQINRELAEGNKRLESEMKARDVEIAKRGKRLEDLQTTVEQQGEEIRELGFRLDTKIEEVQQHNEYLQAAITRDTERAGVRIKGLEDEKERLRVLLGAKSSDINGLFEIEEELKGKIESLEKVCKARSLKINGLEEDNSSLSITIDNLRDGLAVRERTISEQREKIEQLENKIAVANEEAEQLEREAEQLTSDANKLERQLVKAQEFRQQLIDGLNFAFDGEVSAERLAGTLELLTQQEPAVKEQVRQDLEFLRSRNAEMADDLATRKQDAIDRIKAAAPGAWRVVGARPLHEGEDDGDNEEASPEKEESRES